jgi:DNA-binding transcriptional MocR family regulator
MTSVNQVTSAKLPELRENLAAIKAKGIKLNLTRGVPSPAQLALSNELLALPGVDGYLSDSGIDCRNYGGLQGLPEALKLFSSMLAAPPEQIIVGNNASLALMHDLVAFSLLKGNADSPLPWSKVPDLTFLCPVPGYDRHFRICEDLGIRMISVPLLEDGPDMDQVEKLASHDASIKGMWCVPKYSNPSGTVYSAEVIERLAKMNTAAPDFRLFWDNAYAVHHLTDERIEIASILDACARAGNPNRAFVIASTSKITLAGSGLSLFASSPENVKWLLARQGIQTIGPDKINQLRHVRFLKDAEGIHRLMDRHRALIAPKFHKVIEIFTHRLSGIPGVSWTQPKGGYFIALSVPNGCATRVVALAKEAGILLTPAGATHPYGKDPDDSTIRIAPTFPDLSEVAEATETVALCVQLAIAESETRPSR